MTSLKEDLQQLITESRDKLSAIEDAEAEERNARLLGKCYKFRNSFSCPQSAADYWWLYLRVTTIVGHEMGAWQFQCKKDGGIEILPNAFLPLFFPGPAYIEISDGEFRSAWHALCETILGLEIEAQGKYD